MNTPSVVLWFAILAQARLPGAPPASDPAEFDAEAGVVPVPPVEEQVRQLLAEADAAYKVRDQGDAIQRHQAALEKALALDGKQYGALWRMARHFFWVADGKPAGSEEKKNLGKTGWDWAEKAVAVQDGLEGRYYAALTMGAYGQGLGIISALRQGIEGKFLGHLNKAIAIDKKYDNAGPLNALGRFYFELPWPKYDGDKSMELLREAIKLVPNDLRARVYLADTLLEEDQPAEAKKLLDEVLASRPGVDPPEERRAQELAKALTPKVKKALE